jgi:hypothetical protein
MTSPQAGAPAQHADHPYQESRHFLGFRNDLLNHTGVATFFTSITPNIIRQTTSTTTR